MQDKQTVVIDNPVDFEKKYQELKKKITSLLKEEELKTEEINLLKTDDLTEDLKKQNNELTNLQKLNKKLTEKLSVYEAVRDKIKQKEEELEELKNTIIARYQLEKDDLEDLLEAQTDFFQIVKVWNSLKGGY